MRALTSILLILGLWGCNSNGNSNRQTQMKEEHTTESPDLETLAFEGIQVDFLFDSNKPTFGDLFLLVGFENPNFPPDSREFEQLQDLGFEQVDDFFGIRNATGEGDDVSIWLFPIVNGEEVHHHNGPFDGIRLTYTIIRNKPETADRFKDVYLALSDHLDVTPVFNGRPQTNYEDIEKTIIKTIQYCWQELKVEPGSDAALQLDW